MGLLNPQTAYGFNNFLFILCNTLWSLFYISSMQFWFTVSLLDYVIIFQYTSISL